MARKCKVCESRLKKEIERLLLERKMSFRSIAIWAKNQGGDLEKENVYQHFRRHMADKPLVRVPKQEGQSSEKAIQNLSYHAMLRELIAKIYQKVDVEKLNEKDMLSILHLLARLTDLISKVETRKIEGSAVVSKLLEARAGGTFKGWIEGEEVEAELIEEGPKEEVKDEPPQ